MQIDYEKPEPPDADRERDKTTFVKHPTIVATAAEIVFDGDSSQNWHDSHRVWRAQEH